MQHQRVSGLFIEETSCGLDWHQGDIGILQGTKELFMSIFSNIWDHPKTSAAGLLIAVVSIAGVLSQQGITLGSAGTGTVVTLMGAIASALLGLLAKDPAEGASQPAGQSSGQQSKLGAWALIALLLPLPFVGGCSATTVAQNIVNWTPALQSALTAMDSAGALLAPADAKVFAAATAGFDAASNLLAAQAKAYLANPSANNLTQLQNQIVILEQQVNTAMLQAARIMNPASQQHALATIQSVGTVVIAILALVQSVSTKAEVAQMAERATVKIADVQAYVNQEQAAEIVARHYDEPVALARIQVAQVEQGSVQAGF
jgi:hypothetical protein